MGAPVVAYCRLDEREIRTCERVVTPDCVIVIDPTLVHQVDLFAGLGPDGYMLLNSRRTLDELGLGSLAARFRPERLLTVPATEVALRQIGRPLPNAACSGVSPPSRRRSPSAPSARPSGSGSAAPRRWPSATSRRRPSCSGWGARS